MFKGRFFAARYFNAGYFGEAGIAPPPPVIYGALPASRSGQSTLSRGQTGSVSRSYTRPDGVRR